MGFCAAKRHGIHRRAYSAQLYGEPLIPLVCIRPTYQK
jgi:hypothetical protein